MSPDFLDRYSRGNTLCHRLSVETKLVATGLLIFAAAVIPVSLWPLQGCLMAVLFAGLSVAEIPARYIVRRVQLILPLLVMAGLTGPLAKGWEAGFEMMFSILLRGLVSFLAALWLVNVTPFDCLLDTLQRYGMPKLFAMMLSFMYRFLFVLLDEHTRLSQARRMRTLHHITWWGEWTGLARGIAILIIRGLCRAERVHGAMLSRGFHAAEPARRVRAAGHPVSTP